MTPRVYLDCCVLLNLYSTRRCEEILAANAGGIGRFAVSETVVREAQFVQNPPGVSPEREQVDVGPVVANGILTVERLESDDERLTFVALAATLDDGEAETAALAFHRNGIVATDDGAAMRTLAEVMPSMPVVRTSALVKSWADRVHASAVRQALNDIRTRARFVPGPSDPLRDWWVAAAA